MLAVRKREIYRYLGYGGREPEPEIVRMADACLADLRRAATPRCIFREYPIERESSPGPDGTAPLRIAGVEIRSRSLSRNLRGCGEACLMGATLGLGPDRLLARAGVSCISRAVVLQAAAAAMIEAWCDQVNREIIAGAAKRGLYCRPRFSPGYGDFPLAHQRDFAQILRLQKEIGVTLTESLLMMPSKSVTAIIGLSKDRADCALQGCEACDRSEDCAFSTKTRQPA